RRSRSWPAPWEALDAAAGEERVGAVDEDVGDEPAEPLLVGDGEDPERGLLLRHPADVVVGRLRRIEASDAREAEERERQRRPVGDGAAARSGERPLAYAGEGRRFGVEEEAAEPDVQRPVRREEGLLAADLCIRGQGHGALLIRSRARASRSSGRDRGP